MTHPEGQGHLPIQVQSSQELLQKYGPQPVDFTLEDIRREWADLAGNEMVISSNEEIVSDFYTKELLMDKLQYLGHRWRWDAWTNTWFVEDTPGKWIPADPKDYFTFKD